MSANRINQKSRGIVFYVFEADVKSVYGKAAVRFAERTAVVITRKQIPDEFIVNIQAHRVWVEQKRVFCASRDFRVIAVAVHRSGITASLARRRVINARILSVCRHKIAVAFCARYKFHGKSFAVDFIGKRKRYRIAEIVLRQFEAQGKFAAELVFIRRIRARVRSGKQHSRAVAKRLLRFYRYAVPIE